MYRIKKLFRKYNFSNMQNIKKKRTSKSVTVKCWRKSPIALSVHENYYNYSWSSFFVVFFPSMGKGLGWVIFTKLGNLKIQFNDLNTKSRYTMVYSSCKTLVNISFFFFWKFMTFFITSCILGFFLYLRIGKKCKIFQMWKVCFRDQTKKEKSKHCSCVWEKKGEVTETEINVDFGNIRKEKYCEDLSQLKLNWILWGH